MHRGWGLREAPLAVFASRLCFWRLLAAVNPEGLRVNRRNRAAGAPGGRQCGVRAPGGGPGALARLRLRRRIWLKVGRPQPAQLLCRFEGVLSRNVCRGAPPMFTRISAGWDKCAHLAALMLLRAVGRKTAREQAIAMKRGNVYCRFCRVYWDFSDVPEISDVPRGDTDTCWICHTPLVADRVVSTGPRPNPSRLRMVHPEFRE
jgi:hypothetical protein